MKIEENSTTNGIIEYLGSTFSLLNPFVKMDIWYATTTWDPMVTSNDGLL